MLNYLRQWLIPRRRLAINSATVQSAIAEACLIGVVSGLSAVLLKQSVNWLGSWRVQASEVLPAILALPAFGLFLGLLSGLIIEHLAVEASGSGVPQIKGALAQFPIVLNLRVALVKLVSSILSMAAGLTLGRQGPTVHIGAALAAQFSRWMPTSPEHRRQMIAAGAGAGLAAGFNAPLAGIMFILEELLQDVSQLTLATAILACFIGAVISRLLGGHSLDLNLEQAAHSSSSFTAPEIPFYLLLGILAGLLGALFHQGILASLKFYRRLKLSLPLKIGLAAMICGCVVALLPPDFRNNSGLREFLITGDPDWEFTSLVFVAYFILTLVSYGSGASGGLFHPSLVLGAALGYLVGKAQFQVLGMDNTTTYALAGMGAFFSAVSKVPITAIVIVFEMTTDFNMVLPLMITSVVSYLLANKLAKGSLYQQLLEWKGYTLPTLTVEQGSLAGLTASDLMQRRVETLPSQMTLDKAVQAFGNSHHRGFPVIDKGQLVGIVTQTDLAEALQRKTVDWGLRTGEGNLATGKFVPNTQAELLEEAEIQAITMAEPEDTFTSTENGSAMPKEEIQTKTSIKQEPTLSQSPNSPLWRKHTTLAQIMTPRPVTVKPTDSLSHVLYLLNRYQLSRLPVTEGDKLVGIITRADIIRAEADKLSGDTNRVGSATEPSYVVYQTRAPAVGKGRILVPLGKPETAQVLLRLAAAVARDRNYELECLQIITIPRTQNPTQTPVNTTNNRRLLRQAEKLGRRWRIPIHTQVRVSHDVAPAILETIQERHISMIFMNWQGEPTNSPGYIFGNVIDTLIRQAPCDLVLVKLGHKEEVMADGTIVASCALPLVWQRWLVPIAGGPNSQCAVQMIPAFTTFASAPQINLAQVFPPSDGEPDIGLLQRAASFLEERLNYRVAAIPIRAYSVSESLINLATSQRCDVVILGASREGLLQQAIHGNIPEAIARGVDSTVILVRQAL